MKFFKIVAIVSFIGLLLQIYAHYNLMVSYKYEVDLMETHIKTSTDISNQEKDKRYKEMNQRRQEIVFQQKVVRVLLWTFALAFMGSIVIYI